MDRRRFQIQSKVDEITEEKNLLQLYLDKIINQIHSCVDLANGSRTLKHKDCTLILKYELEVLKKITEMIFELECLVDQSPLDQLKTATFQNYSTVAIKSTELKAEDTLSTETQEQIALPQQSEFSNAASSSVQLEIDSENSNVETQSCFSDIDIQVLRDTLKKFNEKIGLNPDYISSLTDVYQKSSSNSTEYYNEPSTSQRIQCTNLDIENDVIVENGFEIPEKDTNKTYESKSQENYNAISQIVESSTFLENETVNSSLCQASQNLDLIKSEEDTSNKFPEKPYTVDEDCSSDLSSGNINQSCSSEECLTNETNHCLIPLVDENSIVVGSIVDEGCPKTDDNIKPTNKPVYSAIEKLNNIKFFDRQAEALAEMQAVNRPDISLQPTEYRIKNNWETNDKKSKKKKNKKNKFKDNEFYELVPKSTPQVGSNCAFSHIERPNEFYLHIVDNESSAIDGLTEKLNDMFIGTVSDYSSKEDAFNAIGKFCFCFVSSYNAWYRAKVVNWELESKSDDVVVQFVDYGDKRRTTYKNLRRMTKELAEIPMLAVRCHLALMYPPNSTVTQRLTEWPSATIDALMDLSGLLGRGEGVRDKIFRIVYANQEENSVSVDLHNLQDNEEQTVGQILLDLGLAVQIIEEYDEEHAELGLFLQDVDSLERADNINEAVMGYDPRDEVRICRFAKSDGTCYKGKNCKLEHVPLSKDGFTTDKIPIFKEAMYSLILPAKGEYVDILITAYKDVCNFFAQIIWRPRKENSNKYVIDEDLYSLLANMNMPKTIQSYEAFKIAPAIGEIVIVKHWSNKCLRAVVREEIVGTDGEVKYQIFTLDFGECINVPLDALWKIKPHFLELPFQAVQCYLHNSVARQDCDKKQAKKFFLENLYYSNFAARTLSSALPMKLAVWTFDRKDIGKMLIDKGFAKVAASDINPADECCLELF